MRNSARVGATIFAAVLLWPGARGVAQLLPPCPGDCDGNRLVTVGELLQGLRIALDRVGVAECSAMDGDGNGLITVNELTMAVSAALSGCPVPPTPTPTVSPTTTPTPSVTNTPIPTPPLSARVCGNGTTEPGEACDDGNRDAGDGCDARCRSESQSDPCAGVTPVSGLALSAVRVASGLQQPLYATAPPGDLARLFIVEQRGRIRVLKDGALLAAPFLDIAGRVVAGGERGMLSMAFHPQYAVNGEFFVAYTTPRGEELFSIVSRFRVTDDPDRADPDSERIVLELRQPFVSHNGGQLAFDGDGYLYTSFGDGGRAINSQNNGQDPTTWLGKILRLDIDGDAPYAIPRDNPFAGSQTVRPEIWALGLRNPWRVSVDAASGHTYIGDVGEGRWEEIDVIPAGTSGANFGWCCREGPQAMTGCFQAAATCPASGLVEPTLAYDHSNGCSVTGGFVYRGCALPDLRGAYFYGDFCTGLLRSFVYLDGTVTDERDWTDALAPADGTTIDRIAGFGQDGRGELYVCDLGGEVFKIVPAPPRADDPTPASSSP
jgi:cysteine-rich repeat protein